jgi:hypothetical protein
VLKNTRRKKMTRKEKIDCRLVSGGKYRKEKNDVREVEARDDPSYQQSGTMSKLIAGSTQSLNSNTLPSTGALPRRRPHAVGQSEPPRPSLPLPSLDQPPIALDQTQPLAHLPLLGVFPIPCSPPQRKKEEGVRREDASAVAPREVGDHSGCGAGPVAEPGGGRPGKLYQVAVAGVEAESEDAPRREHLRRAAYFLESATPTPPTHRQYAETPHPWTVYVVWECGPRHAVQTPWMDVANMASYAFSSSMILVINDNMINGTNHIV